MTTPTHELEMKIHDLEEAITIYAEVWAWAKLASVFASGLGIACRTKGRSLLSTRA